jgi:serine phosphatase RsbU (regulator of sigma subunit)
MVCEILTEHLTDAAGGDGGSVSLLRGKDLVLARLRGGSPGASNRYATYPLAANTPAGEALRSGEALVLVGREAISSRFPGLALAGTGERSIVCLPLISGGRRLGVATMSFSGRRDFEESELAFFTMLADVCSHSLDRIEAINAAADREAKLNFLAAASAEMAADLDYETTLKTISAMAIPWFADWCTIALHDGRVLRPLSVAHRNPDHAEVVDELQRRYPPSPDPDRGTYRVYHSGVSEVVPEITDEVLEATAIDHDHLHLLKQLEFRSAMACPLTGHNGVLGVITWVAGEGGRRFSNSDLAFGEDLARRAASAIDNALLHQQVERVQIHLQEAVLTKELPQVPGTNLAVTYRPAGRTEVGGDFYDAIALPDGRLVTFVGDVEGRGLAAATTMAHVRAAVRTLAALDPDPVNVLERLDHIFSVLELPSLVTLVYVLLDPERSTAEIGNAGHMPVLMRSTEGSVSEVETPGLLLGVGNPSRTSAQLSLSAGDALLLYTDGLVERRGEDLDDGIARVSDYLRLNEIADPSEWLDGLVDQQADPQQDDDVAALLLVLT